MARAWFAAWLVLVAPACGGIAEGRSVGSEESGGEASTIPDPPKQGGHVPIEGDTELGPCELGAPEGASDVCPWVAARRCYTTREMACNCACPRSRDSLCLSGFEAGPRGHVAVTCD